MPRGGKSIYWLVLAATAWGAFSRFYRLDSLPPPAWVDELWFALRARDLLQTGQFQVFYRTFWGGVQPLLVWLTAGVDLLGLASSPIASRAVSAAAGVVGIPLAFVCFDELLRAQGWPAERRHLAAALGALILSALLYTVVVSRVGTEPALAASATLLFVWQLRRAVRLTLRSSRARDGGRRRLSGAAAWLLAGLVLGVSQYISPHARFTLLLAGWLGLHALYTSSPARRPAIVAGLASAAALAGLVALPLVAFYVREPEWFLGRARTVMASVAPGDWLGNLRLIVLSFFLRGDFNPRHNLPGRAMFDWIQLIGLWIGVGWALARAGQSAAARDLLVWAAIMLVPSVLTDGAPQFERLIGFAAPAAALVAVGWLALWDRARAVLGARRRTDLTGARGSPWLAAAGAGLLSLSLVWNTGAYFLVYPRSPEVPAAFTTTPVQLAQAMSRRAETETVYVERAPEADDIFAFDFLLPGSGVQRLDFRQCLPLSDERAQPTSYLVLADRDPRTTALLARAYPAAQVTHLEPEAATLMGPATLVEVPAGEPAPPAPHPAHAQFGEGVTLVGYDWSGPVVHPGASLLLTLYWKAQVSLSADLTAFAHLGTGLNGQALIGQRDGPPCQGLYPTSSWRAGDLVPDSFAVTVRPEAEPGEYALSVGWYAYPSLQRLPLLTADDPLPDNRAVVMQVEVRP